MALASMAWAGDWPHPRGPAFDGTLAAPGTFDNGAGLELAWKVPLGSGYSAVVAAEGRVVTMFAADGADWVGAFDAATGKPLWRYRLDDTYKGHDGSDDGPLSSPTIGAGSVFALGPNGQLVALKLADGKKIWTRRLKDDLGAEAPDYGYATTPLVEGGVLVIQAGGSGGRAVCGLDVKTGKTRWTLGDESVAYQSPAVLDLAGRRQLVVITQKNIKGIAPESGKSLWTYPLGEDDWAGSATAGPAGDDAFVASIGGKAAVFRVRSSTDGYTVEEVYRSDALGRGYAQPVYHDGHLYGLKGGILTCMRAADGERVWRSREPGGDGLLLIDGHLVVFGAKGNVVVAEATPEGYHELARVQALAGSGLTWPSFADGRVFLRNLDELAAVAVTHGAAASASGAPHTADTAFARWLRTVENAADRQAEVDAFLAAQSGFPLVEGRWVHFLWSGEATDVAIAGSMIDSERAVPLERLTGTNLFYRSFELEPGMHWEYDFQIDYGDWVPDPRNPQSVPQRGGGDLSMVATGDWAEAAYLAEPAGPRGRLDGFTLTSEALGYDKAIQVWLPPGYDESETAYPLVLVNAGKSWLEQGRMAASLDNLVGRQVAPVVVAFIEAAPEWWLEAGGSRTADYVRMQVEELVPALQERYRLIPEAAGRAVLGDGYYATSALYAVLSRPETFGAAAVQSATRGLGVADELESLIATRAGQPLRFYLDWNRYDERNGDRGYDFAEDSRVLAGRLAEAGFSVAGGEVADGHGWGARRNRTDRMLLALFPLR